MWHTVLLKNGHDTDQTKAQQFIYSSNEVVTMKKGEGKILSQKLLLNYTHLNRIQITSQFVLQEPKKVILTSNITIKWNPVDSNSSLFVVGNSTSYKNGEISHPYPPLKLLVNTGFNCRRELWNQFSRCVLNMELKYPKAGCIQIDGTSIAIHLLPHYIKLLHNHNYLINISLQKQP